jgi:hypothetical protein
MARNYHNHSAILPRRLMHFCEQFSSNIAYIALKMPETLPNNIPQSAALEWAVAQAYHSQEK